MVELGFLHLFEPPGEDAGEEEVPEDYRTNVRKSRGTYKRTEKSRGSNQNPGSSRYYYFFFFFAAFLTFLTAFLTAFFTAFFLAAIPLHLLRLILSPSLFHGLHAGPTSNRRAGAPQNPGSH
jgi:hypothetical protein